MTTINSKRDYENRFSKHGGKLAGMYSLSTSPLENTFCKQRHAVAGLVCSGCFSYALNDKRDGLRNKLIDNYNIFTSEIIPFENIPYINDTYFRIESFGDLQNVTQAINYLNLIIKNNRPADPVYFGWWTKNPVFIAKALKQLGIEKPDNVQIIFSAPCLNRPVNIEVIKKVFPFIDKVFTVYTKKYAKDNNITINCGGRHCLSCLNCYKAGGADQINEQLKKV